jgi:hypothetical protein
VTDTAVLDVHGHVSLPPESMSYAVGLMATNTPLSDPGDGGDGLSAAFAVPDEKLAAAVYKHVAAIDSRRIDVQLVGPRPFMMLGFMEPHLQPMWCRYVNRLIHFQCELFPDRFAGACQLPQRSEEPDTRHCVHELERCVDDYGFQAAYVSPDPGGRNVTPGMHEPYWFPLYERAEELDVTLIVHGTTSLDPRFRAVPHNYQLGFLTEQYLARQFLGHSDVFIRYPALRVVICHCGGALDRFIATDFHLPQRNLEDNLFVDSCAYDVALLEAAIRQFGPKRVCFGTEAPGSGGAIRPETGRPSDDLVPVLESFDWLTAADRQQILHDTPLRACPSLRNVQAS